MNRQATAQHTQTFPDSGGAFLSCGGEADALTSIPQKQLANSLKSFRKRFIDKSPIHRYAVFKPVKMTYKQWTLEIEHETIKLMNGDDWTPPGGAVKVGEAQLKRVSNLRQCLPQIRAAECSCGSPIPSTGRIEPLTQPCNSRLCPACNRRRSAKLMTWGAEIFRHVSTLPQKSEGSKNSYRLITLTRRYEAWNWKDVSIHGLKRRTREYREIWGDLWQWLKNRGGSNQGAYRAIEIAGTGHVHCHVLHWGPYIDINAVTAYLKEHWPGTWIDIRGTAQDRLSGAAAELFKYSVKGPGMSNLDWLSGQKVQSIHPALAARVLVAWHGQRTAERYGVFRQVPKPEDCDTHSGKGDCNCSLCREQLAIDAIPCPHCGLIEKHRATRTWKTDQWIAFCKEAQAPPLISQIIAIKQKNEVENGRNTEH